MQNENRIEELMSCSDGIGDTEALKQLGITLDQPTLLEYAKQHSEIELQKWQIDYLSLYDKCMKTGKRMFCILPSLNGKTMVNKIINEYRKKFKI